MSGIEQGFLPVTREEMERKWNAEIERNTEDRENWIVWKAMAIKRAAVVLACTMFFTVVPVTIISEQAQR